MKNQMRVWVLILVVAMTTVMGGCSSTEESEEWVISDAQLEMEQEMAESGISIANVSEEEMYEEYIQVLLSEELWNLRDAYDTCHYLMVPMYYAFQVKNDDWVRMFTEHMSRFLSAVEKGDTEFDSLAKLTQNHYLYWTAEYMCLCVEYGYEVPEGLWEYVYDKMQTYVVEHTQNFTPADGISYDTMWDLFDGLLEGEGYGRGWSYDHVFTDNELFPLAILCDLSYVNRYVNKGVIADESDLDNAAAYSIRIMQSRVTWYDDRTWQFQVGMWSDYSDMLYAEIDNPENIIEGEDYRDSTVVQDSSHFSRFPLFIRSFRRAQTNESDKGYFTQLLDALGATFVQDVLVQPDEDCPYYRTTNYMDGRNGLYRYGYHEDGVGYRPYQLSTTFLRGWWAFCDNETISEAYIYTAEQFPLDEEGVEVYRDPVTVRDQNAIFLSEGYEQFLCYLAGKIK